MNSNNQTCRQWFHTAANPHALLAFVAILWCSAPVFSAPITYSFTGVGSGELDGVVFNDANFRLTAQGNTESFNFSFNSNFNSVDHRNLVSTLRIDGLPTATLTNGLGFFNNGQTEVLGVFDENAGDLLRIRDQQGVGLSSFDATTSIGPITTSDPDLANFNEIATDQGLITFTELSTLSFAAQLPVDDQFHNAFTAPNPTGELGGPSINPFQTALQTFTVGVGGTLAEVALQVQQSDTPLVPDGDLVLTLYGTSGGGGGGGGGFVPDFSQNLGSVSLPAASFPEFDGFASGPFTTFDVSGLGIKVAPGDVLAFGASYPNGSGSYFIYDSEVDSYAGGTSFVLSPLDGSAFARTPRDLGFWTTVTVPEPPGTLILGMGALVAAVILRN